MSDDYDDVDVESVTDRIEDLESQLEELRGELESGSHVNDGLSLGYALGMTIAVVLSWSRNASILWCMFHGVLSWGYVIYFAATR